MKSDLAKVKADNADLRAVLFAGVACDDDTLVSRSQGSQECNTLVTGAEDADITLVAKLKAVAKVRTHHRRVVACGAGHLWLARGHPRSLSCLCIYRYFINNL